MKDEETKSRFVELRAKGWSYARIAKAIDVSKPTLISWAKELKGVIANLRAIELEALQEEYFITRVKRIELLGKQVKAIEAELNRRKLKEVPTEWLLDYLTRSIKLLKEEEVTPIFSEELDATVALMQTLDKTTVSWSA